MPETDRFVGPCFMRSIKLRAAVVMAAVGFCCTLSSCGYTFSGGRIVFADKSISIPYVEGDRFGSLTSALVKQLTGRAGLRYAPSGGDLLLKVSIIDKDDENIGFRYDHESCGKLTKYVVPVESRTTVKVEVTLLDPCSSAPPLLGPVQLSAKLDFDHEYYSSTGGANIFSLGQLTDIDGARDAVLIPLYEQLAEHIVDYILESW